MLNYHIQIVIIESSEPKSLDNIHIIMTSAAIKPNMDFMVEKSYPCMSDGCDKVFYLKANLKKHIKYHSKKMQKKNHVACTAIKQFLAHKISNCISRRVNRMEIGTSTADTMVLVLIMHIMAVLNSSSQHSKRCLLPTGKC